MFQGVEDYIKQTVGSVCCPVHGDWTEIICNGLNLSDTDFEWQLMTRNKFPTKGQILVYVWVVGTDYPLACHISLEAGSLDDGEQYTDAALGAASKEHLSRLVKDHINLMIKRFAVNFFEVRNES